MSAFLSEREAFKKSFNSIDPGSTGITGHGSIGGTGHSSIGGTGHGSIGATSQAL